MGMHAECRERERVNYTNFLRTKRTYIHVWWLQTGNRVWRNFQHNNTSKGVDLRGYWSLNYCCLRKLSFDLHCIVLKWILIVILFDSTSNRSSAFSAFINFSKGMSYIYRIRDDKMSSGNDRSIVTTYEEAYYILT